MSFVINVNPGGVCGRTFCHLGLAGVADGVAAVCPSTVCTSATEMEIAARGRVSLDLFMEVMGTAGESLLGDRTRSRGKGFGVEHFIVEISQFHAELTRMAV